MTFARNEYLYNSENSMIKNTQLKVLIIQMQRGKDIEINFL